MNNYNHLFVPIPGFPGYEINLNGEIWSDRSDRVLAGTITRAGYLQFFIIGVELKGFAIYLSRIMGVAFLGLKVNSQLQIDHRDEDKSNNDISNLRIASNSENQYNTTAYSNNTSGVHGVHLNKKSGRWIAQISLGHKQFYLGSFANIGDAAAARKEAEIKYQGTFRPGYVADQPANEEGAL